jgi:SAM-dependent methyltransferase
MGEEIRLDLGCGKTKRHGYVGVDIARVDGVDVVCNFEAERLPFEDNTISHVYSSHLIEHLEKPAEFMKEIHRVLGPRGMAEIKAPFAGHPNSFQFDHKRFFKARDFYFYEPENECHYYVGEQVKFKVIGVKYGHGYRVLHLLSPNFGPAKAGSMFGVVVYLILLPWLLLLFAGLWIKGTIVQAILNLGLPEGNRSPIRRIREIYECYLHTWFPLKEFTVFLEKV